MRIGVNTLFLIPGEVGGSETYLAETLMAMRRVAPEDQLVLFTNRENEALWHDLFGDDPGVKRVSLSFCASRRPVRIIREQLQLPWETRREKIDVLWSPGYTAPLFAPCPQVVSILDMQYRRFPQDMAWLARMVNHFLVTQGAKRAQHVLTLSSFSKEEIILFTEVAPERITPTPLAADRAFSESAAPETVKKVRKQVLGFDDPYLLCVAHTYPHKNVETLVRAYGDLQESIPHHLVLVGRGRLGEKAVQQAIKQLPDCNRLHRVARVTHEQLVALYQQADLFVFPSRYEGFGLPVLEAMSAGVPVVTTQEASVPEVGSDDVVYFDAVSAEALATQVRKVLRWSEEDRKTLCRRARQRSEMFSWERTAKQTLQVLKGVVRERESLL